MCRVALSPYLFAGCALALALGKPMEFTAALFCIFIHECAHACAAHLIGFTVREIRLSPIGASLSVTPNVQDNAKSELLIAAAGPAASFVFALFFSYLQHIFLFDWLTVLALYNALFGAFNLLPALPMDGGRMLRACLLSVMPHARAARLCGLLGIFCGGSLMILSFAGVKIYGFNVTLFLCGAAVALYAVRNAREKIVSPVLESYKKCDAVRGGGSLAVREIAVSADQTLADVAHALRSDAFYRIHVYDENMRKLCTSDENRLTDAITRFGAQQSVRTLCR